MIRPIGLLLTLSCVPAHAAELLATAAAPVEVGSGPVRVVLNRMRPGQATALVVSGVEGDGGSGVYNLFLDAPNGGERILIGTFSLFDTGPRSGITVTIPPSLRDRLDGPAAMLEIAPTGTAPARRITLDGLSLYGE